MTEINFYQIDDVITKSIAPLLIKIIESNKKALIFCKNSATTKEIDDSLWSYGRNKFIPHATKHDKNILENFGWEQQPIAIFDEEKNINQADYIILIEDANIDFIKKFERVFYFYDAIDENLAKKLKKIAAKINSYKKFDGKWISQDLKI